MVLPAPGLSLFRRCLVATVTLAVAVGIVSSPAAATAPRRSAGGQSDPLATLEPLGPGGQVVIIIVDGLRPDLISAENTPTLTRLIEEGAATLEAQTVRPNVTLPAITSILTGIRPRDHRVTWNDYEPDRGVVEATTVFHVVKEAGLGTAFFSGKVKLRHAAPPEVIDNMSVRFLPDVSVVILARGHLPEAGPGLTVVHLPNNDRAGHEYGWGSKQQREALRATDIAIASLIETIETDERIGPTRVIVTADHGGDGKNHQRRSRLTSTVPWIIWGASVEPAELESVSVLITAATALRSLGLEVPGHMIEGGLE